MDLYGRQNKSIPQKIIIHVMEVLWLWLSFWVLFKGGGDFCEENLHITNAAGSQDRRMIIFVFSLVIFLRIAYTMIFLLKRRIPWEECASVSLAFGFYFVGFSLFVLPTIAPAGVLDYLAVLLFVVGCVLNSGSEIMRDRWKKIPENKGKIYTGGLFRYSRHINYFGDLLWITAYAMVTGNIWSAFIPVLLFCFFAFYNAPKLDSYLKQKYGKGYEDYAKKTKMIIPFIY
jgi:protein-S-isoprenylcysteine O-methyltransferase Ste14